MVAQTQRYQINGQTGKQFGKKQPEYKEPLALLRRRLVLLVLTVLVIVGLPSVWRAFQEERQSAEFERESSLQLSDLQQRKAQLESHIADLTSTGGMEAAVRARYDVGKAGEHLVIIVDPSASPTTTTATSSKSQQVFHMFPW